MWTNEGKVDRVIRILLGAILIAAGVYFKSWWGAVGAIPLLTGFVGICLIYKILGVSTCCTTCKIK